MTDASEPVPWPPYFQPSPGQQASPADDERLPVSLMDLFYLGEGGATPSRLVIVAACLGGALAVFAGDDLEHLPEHESALTDRVEAQRVAQRGAFRAVAAPELFVYSLDAVEQRIQSVGFNDAIYLYGTVQARLVAGDAIEVQPLSARGRLAVGRLDLLRAFQAALASAPDLATPDDTLTYRALVPAAPVEVIEQGQGLVLVYPLLDLAVAPEGGNAPLVMQIVHDLLLGLQRDLRTEAPSNPFANLSLPVPSRSQLEAELRLDGYAVEGNVATKRAKGWATGTSAATPTLDRLRAWIAGWSAPSLELPVQAEPRDYAALIDYALRSVGGPDDARMARALDQLVQRRAAQSRSREASTPSPAPTTTTDVRAPQPPRAATPTPRAGSARGQHADYAADFAAAMPTQSPPVGGEWWRDFESAGVEARKSTWVTARPDRQPTTASGDAAPTAAEPPIVPSRRDPNDFAADFGPTRTESNGR